MIIEMAVGLACACGNTNHLKQVPIIFTQEMSFSNINYYEVIIIVIYEEYVT